MGYVTFSYPQLHTFCTDAFVNFGFRPEQSEIISDVLLTSDLYGMESHGLQRAARYHKLIRSGMIDVQATPEVVFETPVSAVVDGHDGMGQLVAEYCMQLAIQKAKKTGLAMVSARNSNHYGIAGYYGKLACDQGLIGLCVTNSEAILVPTGGRKAMIGSNPISVCVPADPYPFLFDAPATVVTRGKVELCNKQGIPLREGWVLDENGKDTTDAARVLDNIKGKKGGGILPLGGSSPATGGHKGYGWGIVCELFSSILSMGLTSNHTHVGGKSGTCHGFAVIDPAIFGDPAAIREHFSTFLTELRESDAAEGQSVITHGQKEAVTMAQRKAEGIPVGDKTLKELYDLCADLGMDFAAYFPGVQLPA